MPSRSFSQAKFEYSMIVTTSVRTFAFVAIGCLALLATGCSPAQVVVGTWELDTNSAISNDLQKSAPALPAQMLFMKPEIRMTFEGTGGFAASTKFAGQGFDVKGSWRFVKADGKALILMVKEAGKTDENEVRFTLLDDNDHAEISRDLNIAGQSMKPAIKFVRVKPAS